MAISPKTKWLFKLRHHAFLVSKSVGGFVNFSLSPEKSGGGFTNLTVGDAENGLINDTEHKSAVIIVGKQHDVHLMHTPWTALL